MSKFQLIGWSARSLLDRADEMNTSIKDLSKQLDRPITVFTSESEAGGNKRGGIKNSYIEHKKFFDKILNGEYRNTTIVNYGMFIRHQLNIEFSQRSAISKPSKTSIIDDCGQYFYREVFTNLFTPIIRGYKIDDSMKRNSSYSFYMYTQWLYSFIQNKYNGKKRSTLFIILKMALGEIHDFFIQKMNVSTTSLLYIYLKYNTPKCSASLFPDTEHFGGGPPGLNKKYQPKYLAWETETQDISARARPV